MTSVIKTLLPYLVLVLTVIASYRMISNQKDRIEALEYNERVLTEGQENYRTKNKELVTQINQLIATNEDLYRSDSLSKENLKKMDVKVKNLQNYISMTLSSNTKIEAPVVDITESVKDSVFPSLKIFHYNDGWYKVQGSLVEDSVSLDIECRHKVDIANEMIYKGWWIFKKPKELKTKVLLTNPRDTIEVLRSYKIVKNKLEKLLSE